MVFRLCSRVRQQWLRGPNNHNSCTPFASGLAFSKQRGNSIASGKSEDTVLGLGDPCQTLRR